MSKAEKRQWKELTKQCAPGVLMGSDRLLFAVLVQLATKFYAHEEMKIMETNQMIAICAKFAMSPSDRSKVAVEKPKQSALSAFLAQKTA
jgi:hypothetical protein